MTLTREQQALVKEIRLCENIGPRGYTLGEPRDEVEAQRISDNQQLFGIITAQAERIEELEKEVVESHRGWCWDFDADGDTVIPVNEPCPTCRTALEREARNKTNAQRIGI